MMTSSESGLVSAQLVYLISFYAYFLYAPARATVIGF